MKVLVAALFFFSLSFEVFALKIGEVKPLVQAEAPLRNIDGKEIFLSKMSGENGTLVIFSCNHCPFVKAWEDRIVALGNEYMKKGFGVVMINSNDPAKEPEDSFEKMQERAKQKGIQFPYVVDSTSDFAREFGATKTPEFFLFNTNIKLVYNGAIDDNSEDAKAVKKTFLKDAMDALLAGKAIPQKETKAIGCGIKFRKRA